MKLKQLLKYILLFSLLLTLPVLASSATGQYNHFPQNAWDIPAFKLKGLDGKTHSLEDWKGKVILLNFWASWCQTCLAEIKDFVKFQKHFINNNLQIVSIAIDNAEKVKNIALTSRINYPVLLAPIEQQKAQQQTTKDVLSLWGNPKAHVPYSVIINTNGNIEYVHKGKLDTGRFDYYVRPLLNRN